jgi:hypothetical protein
VCITQAASGRPRCTAEWITKPRLAIGVHLDQAARGDLLEQHAIGIDQEAVAGARQAHREMGEDEIGHAEQRDQPVGRGEVLAQFLLGRDAVGIGADGRRGERHQ